MKKSVLISILFMTALFGNLESYAQSYTVKNDGAFLITAPGNITEFVIPSEVLINNAAYPVIGIGKSAFNSISVLSSLTLPASITYIEEGAFRNTKVENLYIEDIVTWCKIEFECIQLGNNPIKLATTANPIGPDTKLYISNEALEQELIIPSSVTSISGFAFRDLNFKGALIIEEGIEEIGEYAFNNVPVSEIKLPQTLTGISDYAFSNCDFTSINLPSSLKILGMGAFKSTPVGEVNISCEEAWLNIQKGLWYEYEGGIYDEFPFSTKITLCVDGTPIEDFIVPSMYENIQPLEFSGCKTLKSITFEEGVKEIGQQVFENCIDLKSIFFPSTLKESVIYFLNCRELKNIWIKATEVPHIEWKETYNRLPSYITENCTLYVPEESADAYRDNWAWGQFKNIVGIDFESPSGVEYIEINDGRESSIYNLHGQKVNPNDVKHEIYIKNGKKYIAR